MFDGVTGLPEHAVFSQLLIMTKSEVRLKKSLSLMCQR